MHFVAIKYFELHSQENKRIRRMPRRQEAMKDVIDCEKLRLAVNKLSRRYPNGKTHL